MFFFSFVRKALTRTTPQAYIPLGDAVTSEAHVGGGEGSPFEAPHDIISSSSAN